jgi:ribonuclease HI
VTAKEHIERAVMLEPSNMEYRQFMDEAGKKIAIHFQKVAAHTGVELNECADRLAKSALARV